MDTQDPAQPAAPFSAAQRVQPGRPLSGEVKRGGDVIRDLAGETVCGFRVAAYRETHPEHGESYGHRYSEHWSTPSKNPAVTVQRLFTEEQLREALRLVGLTHSELCRLSRAFGQASDYRADEDRRINDWLKGALAEVEGEQ